MWLIVETMARENNEWKKTGKLRINMRHVKIIQCVEDNGKPTNMVNIDWDNGSCLATVDVEKLDRVLAAWNMCDG